MNFIRDNIEHGAGADTLVANSLEAAPIGLPFCMLALSLIGRLKRMQDELIALAATDVLTGLDNRRAFYAKVSAVPDGKSGVLMIIDVDHFKRVNDTYGHCIGDLCLQRIARHLNETLRDTDIVARIGGEEFAVAMIGADREMAEDVGGKLVQGVKFETPQNDTITVTMSVGAAFLTQVSQFESSMGLADQALYRAKSTGRAKLVLASENISSAAA